MTGGHPDVSPLSETQQQVWITEQLDAGRSVFTEAMAVRISGPLDPDALDGALRQVATRHDTLRTVFPVRDGGPVQHPRPVPDVLLTRRDLGDLPDVHRGFAVDQAAVRFVDERRDLATAAPFRGLLLALGPDDHALVLAVHHLAADGWSAGIVMDELAGRYAALLAGRRLDESPPGLRYADFVAWERVMLDTPEAAADTDYWRTALAGAPPLELLPGRERPADKRSVGRVAEFGLDDGLADPLLSMCGRLGVTPYVALLAVFAAVAARWSGQPDLVVATQAANRVHTEFEDVVGQFANTVPIRLDLTGDPAFGAVLRRCADSSTDALERAHIPLRRIVETAAPVRDPSRTALFQHLFTPRERPVRGRTLGPARMEPFLIGRRRARLDTLTEIEFRPGVLRAVVEYDTALFDTPTVERLVGDWSRCLRAWLGDPGLPVSALPLLGPPAAPAPTRPAPPAAPGRGTAPGAEPVELTGLVRSVWQGCLDVGEVGRGADFFALGGHSMLCSRVVHQLQDLLGVELSLRTLFDHPVLEDFVAALERGCPGLESALRTMTTMPADDIERLLGEAPPERAAAVPGPRVLPLTSAQLPIWLAEQRDPGLLTHTIPIVVTVRGAFDVAAFRAALAAVVAHQEGLRATFGELDGRPVQHIAPTVDLDVPFEDLRERPADERAATAAAARARLGAHAFDLVSGPLLAAAVLRLDDEVHHLHLVFHHLITDEVSMAVFMRELVDAYEAVVGGREARLPELPVGLADHVEWEERHLTGNELGRLRSFWRRQLGGAPRLELGTDHPRPATRGFTGEFVAVSEPRAAYDRLDELAGRCGTTPYAVFAATVVTLLHEHTGETDVVIGVPCDNRVMPGSERLIGCFMNVLPLRVDCSGAPPFDEVVRRVRVALVAAYDHQALPLAAIAEAASAGPDPSRSPLFGVTCELQRPDWLPARIAGSALAFDFVSHGTARYELAFHAMVFPSEVYLGVEVNTGLWDRATGATLLARLADLVVRPPVRVEAPA